MKATITRKEPNSTAVGKPLKPLPTDRATFDNQLRIIRGYAIHSGDEGKPVRLNDVAKIVQLHITTVSLANPFFLDNGFITREQGGYMPASEVRDFQNATEWDEGTAGLKLAPLLKKTWFAKTALPLLSMESKPESEIINELALAAKASRKHESKIKVLLEYLEAAGLIRNENGVIEAVKIRTLNEDKAIKKPLSKRDGEKADLEQPTDEEIPTDPGSVNLSFSISVKMSEFAGWQPERISSFFKGLAQVISAKGELEEDNI